MFCAIRKFKNKKSSIGNSKRLEVYTSKYEHEPTKYCYTYSHEKFERPPKDTYLISIQHSYRENGKVQKKQWKVFTINYYELVENYTSWKHYICPEDLNELLEELDLTITQLERMINVKLHPLLEELQAEWEQSNEFQTTYKIQRIIEKHQKKKAIFEEKWGKDTYDYIYDVFGKLRNEDYLNWLEHKNHQSRHYHDHEQHNTDQNNSSLRNSSALKYTEAEQRWLKKFYRTLAKEFHPDVSGDTEAMVLINKLKKDWKI